MSGAEDIRKFAEAYRITFPVGRDSGIAQKLGARGIPVTIFLDRNGRIAKRHIGGIDYAQLSTNIEAILK